MAGAGRYGEAIDRFQLALARRPDDINVLFALGKVAEALGHAAAAEEFHRRVLSQAPDQVEALVSLGNLLRRQSRLGEAITLLQPAIQRMPGEADLWMTLGSALREGGDTANAEVFYREALRLAPRSGLAVGNLAELLADAGDVAGALDLHERAVRLDPRNSQARLNRGLLLLQEGHFDAGWRDYEHRLKIKGREIVADHRLRRWMGEIRPGLRLLVTAEQGVGDQVMFASLIPELSERLAAVGGALVLEAEPRLVSLFSRSFPAATVRPWDLQQVGGEIRAGYGWLPEAGGAEAAIALGSLPGLLRRNAADFPHRDAYLRADTAEQERWRAWLQASGPGPFVGVSWRSGLHGGLRNREYAPLQVWAEFVRALGATPVMLQYSAEPEEIAVLASASPRPLLIPPDLDQRNDLDRTTALAAALDAIVTAPTATAWLSAAAGAPTLKLLHKTTWTAFGQDHEPFAPACTLIRTPPGGDWAAAFDLAHAALRARLS